MTNQTAWADAVSTLHYSVHLGTWINWSRGRIMGATLTLDRRGGNLLIAFTAIFVGLVSERFWRIACMSVSLLPYIIGYGALTKGTTDFSTGAIRPLNPVTLSITNSRQFYAIQLVCTSYFPTPLPPADSSKKAIASPIDYPRGQTTCRYLMLTRLINSCSIRRVDPFAAPLDVAEYCEALLHSGPANSFDGYPMLLCLYGCRWLLFVHILGYWQ